jgi:hypothetical protein
MRATGEVVMSDIVKVCKVHGELKLLDCVPRPMKTKMSYKCRLCKNEKSKEYKKKNADAVLNSHKIYNEKFSKRNNLKKYGLTVEDYYEMLRVQNYACYICKLPETTINSKYKKLHDLGVDHCHKTNKVRGLLCQKCNRGLGYFNDSIEILKSAIIYLQVNG